MKRKLPQTIKSALQKSSETAQSPFLKLLRFHSDLRRAVAGGLSVVFGGKSTINIEREQRRQQMLQETEETLADLEANLLLSGEQVMTRQSYFFTP